ncbi:hypothetical protein [Variovorax sp. LG9.2]|uniref:hypothetical protein n=1 Tax=Variovorax sp. LG9.2 TaxID=3048626 RepID=UPI002B234B4C|nr:hypothetical protein [Variovorax sp. LG9.2]
MQVSRRVAFYSARWRRSRAFTMRSIPTSDDTLMLKHRTRRPDQISERPVLRLVPKRAPVSADTVAALEQLLTFAKAGAVTGMAFGCTFKGGTYVTDITGECAARPTMARGMVSFLSDQLATLVHEKGIDEIR